MVVDIIVLAQMWFAAKPQTALQPDMLDSFSVKLIMS